MLKFNLKKLLFDRDMNMSDLHRKSGVRYNTINAYYHGYIKRMNVADLVKLCETLNCKLSGIIEYVPDKIKKAP
jgi:putative transcriptional regulator